MNTKQRLIPSSKLNPNKSNIYTKLMEEPLSIDYFNIDEEKTNNGRVRYGQRRRKPRVSGGISRGHGGGY